MSKWPPIIVMEIAYDGGVYWVDGQGEITEDFNWFAFHEGMEYEEQLNMLNAILEYDLEPEFKDRIETLISDCKESIGIDDEEEDDEEEDVSDKDDAGID